MQMHHHHQQQGMMFPVGAQVYPVAPQMFVPFSGGPYVPWPQQQQMWWPAPPAGWGLAPMVPQGFVYARDDMAQAYPFPMFMGYPQAQGSFP